MKRGKKPPNGDLQMTISIGGRKAVKERQNPFMCVVFFGNVENHNNSGSEEVFLKVFSITQRVSVVKGKVFHNELIYDT